MCIEFRRPKVFRDITYFVNNIVDNKLSVNNFCAQTSLLRLELRLDWYFPFLLYHFCVILGYVYILSSRWIFQPVSRSKNCLVLLREGTRGTEGPACSRSRWLFVKGSKSQGSSETLGMGRPFTMASTSHIRVVRPSLSSTCSVIKAFKTLHTVQIHHSHTPPWWEPTGGLNIHLTLHRRR